MCQLWREDLADHDQDGQQSAHERHHRRKNLPGFVLAALGGVLGENWNERGAQGCSGHQIVQEIGQSERRIVRVGHGVRADLVRHGPLAKESEQPAGQDAAHYNACGSEYAAMNARIAHASNGRGFGGVRLARSSGRESKQHWTGTQLSLL